jgi:hypothetical protein
MYPYWHDLSHGYDHRCVARGEGGAERGGFVTTPRPVEVARYGTLLRQPECARRLPVVVLSAWHDAI